MPTRSMAGLFQRLSVRTAILAAFGVLLLTAGLAFAVVWKEGRKLQSNYEALRQDSLPAVDALHSLNTAAQFLVQATSYAAMVDLSKTPTDDIRHRLSNEADAAVLHAQVKRAQHELLEAQAEMARALQKIETLDDTDGMLAGAEFRNRLREIAADILEDSRELQDGAIARTQISVAAFTGHLHEDAAILRRSIAEGLAAENLEIENSGPIVATAIRDATIVATVGAALALLIGVCATLFISRGIAAPIGQLRDGARRVGQGDLDIELKVSGPVELQQLAASFEEMTRQLAVSQEMLRRKERLASLGRIAATVSHELRNPLGLVRASIYSIKERTLHKGLGVERALERMERSIDRCVGIINDLLDFARVNDLARETTAIDAWLSEFLAEQQLPAGVSLRMQLACGARASFDRERLERAVANLIANAAQAMTDPQWTRPAGRPNEITVGTAINGPFAEITVADSGPGIAADILPKIFDPLFTTKNFGIGLGLPLVRQIMQQHRGSVAVENNAGGGAAFILRLPLELAEGVPQEKAA
jgi:signal transduction histidine kinase